ncbi:MAG: hypothetical protein ACYCUE_04880 [Steroidobacteraceae bacterium]
MATRKNTAPAEAQSVDASPDIQRTIAEAIELVETTQRALEPNEQRASEYGALGQAVAKLWAAHNRVERSVPESVIRAAMAALRETVSLTRPEQARFRRQLARRLGEAS